MLGLVKSCIGTKFTSQFGDLIAVSVYSSLNAELSMIIHPVDKSVLFLYKCI